MNSTIHYAGLWRRTGATLIDAALILILALITLFVWSTLNNEILDLNQMISIPVLAYAAITFFLLSVLLDSRQQGTPGLKMMDCRLLDAKSGQALGLAQSLMRNLLLPLSFLPAMLGVIWMIFDSKAQMFHDKLAGSVVVIDDIARQALDELDR